MIIPFRKGPVTIGETRYGTEPGKGYSPVHYDGYDVMSFLQCPEPVPTSHVAESHTLLVDLTPDEAGLLAKLHKNSRYEIRKAQQEGFTCAAWSPPTDECLTEFLAFFRAFAESQKLEQPSAAVLKAYAKAGALDLSKVSAADGSVLAWHAHYLDRGRPRLLFSASLRDATDAARRNLISRGNRYLHWWEMLRFKAGGATVYDFGGWYPGKEDRKKLDINAFKESFGGTHERTFNCDLPITLPGRAYLHARRTAQRLSQTRAESRKTLTDTLRRLVVAAHVDPVLARISNHAPRASLRARLAPPYTYYPHPSIRSVSREGLRFEADLSDYMEWCFYYGVEVEPRAQLYGLLRPGDVVLDVGSNIGETLLHFARVVGETGRVYGFEPVPFLYEKCARNLALNSLPQASLSPLALGDEPGRVSLYQPTPRNSGSNRVVPSSGSPAASSTATAETTTADASTIDAFARDQKLERINLIKIDVEGYELNVLRGAAETIARLKPILFVEIDDRSLKAHGGSAKELLGFLEERGYAVTRAESGEKLTSSSSVERQHFDVIARPTG